MKTVMLKGLTDEQQIEMRQAFGHAIYLRKQIIKVLQEKMDSALKSNMSKDAYNIPNWAYLQADAVGYARAMQEVMSLLESEGADRAPEERAASSTIPLETPRKRGRPRKNP